MEAVKELLASVPQGVQAAFAAVGLLYVAARLLASLGFFLDVFVLGGTNVSATGSPRKRRRLTVRPPRSSASMAAKAAGPS